MKASLSFLINADDNSVPASAVDSPTHSPPRLPDPPKRPLSILALCAEGSLNLATDCLAQCSPTDHSHVSLGSPNYSGHAHPHLLLPFLSGPHDTLTPQRHSPAPPPSSNHPQSEDSAHPSQPNSSSCASRPHECKQCTATFKQKVHLTKHIHAVHERRRPFGCTACGACFGRRSDLNKHVRLVHERRRPFVCDVCAAAFGQRGDLNKHTRSVHAREKKRNTYPQTPEAIFVQTKHAL